jgi:hypothetical protein
LGDLGDLGELEDFGESGDWKTERVCEWNGRAGKIGGAR